ncbi:hypothetical protein AWM68_17270 [Fictibacillus phosphorivorans]|uniref:Uncharacterized protein n=2 Tax=Fictibacillus phosphorivorans TaxID=1221500 RepID=A0A163S0X5_9BACL|nr:hypothetical protein AWM68_17270 [Fictibacillus phosphorivorans]
MYVLLSSCGNISYGANALEEKFGVPTQWIKVSDLKEASNECRKFIDEYNLGGSEFIGGYVVEKPNADKLISVISYNGRIWDGKEYQGMYERQRVEYGRHWSNPLTLLDFNKWETFRVSRETLLKHSKYQGDWSKIIDDGWRFDRHFNKFYKIVLIEN